MQCTRLVGIGLLTLALLGCTTSVSTAPARPATPGAVGPAGATGATGATGDTGKAGEPGKPGEKETLIIKKQAPAQTPVEINILDRR